MMKVQFQWVGGATFVLTIGDNLRIACDPVLCNKGTVQDYFWFKTKRLEDPVYDASTFSQIDIWCLTHPHEDHLDSLGMAQIKEQCQVVSDAASATKIQRQRGIQANYVLGWGEQTTLVIKGYKITIEAIPAIHGINPLSAWLAGKVNGYYLTIENDTDAIAIYITGDTVYKNKVVQALKGKKIDLLIPNMGAAKEGSWIMTLTLNARMLQKMMTVLRPRAVVPVHYGTFTHYVEPVSKIQALGDERILLVQVGENRLLTL